MSPSLCKNIFVFVVWSMMLEGMSLRAQIDTVPYCPMAVEFATWIVFDDEGFYSPVGYNGSCIVRIEGDSLYRGQAYKKMWIANLIHDGFDRPEDIEPPYVYDALKLYGLVRDDSIKRRFLGVVPTYQDTNNRDEVLIHDFGIEVGQEMLGVYKFDTVMLDSIVIDTVYNKLRIAHVPPRNDVLTIEGIGTSNTGPLCQNPVIPVNAGFRSLIDYCVGSVEDCGLEITTSNSNVFYTDSNTSMKLYPNPLSVYDVLRVDISGDSSGVLICVNNKGELVFSRYVMPGTSNLQLGRISAGVYSLYFRGVVERLVIF